jgi:HlyD family secretion protein
VGTAHRLNPGPSIRLASFQGDCHEKARSYALAKINLERAEIQWKQARIQAENKSAAGDAALAWLDHEAAKACVTAAVAGLRQNKAALDKAELELDDTCIRSPIKGVVIDLRVNVGQVVGPTPNVPSLFLVAKLEKLQIWASVREADIAKIQLHQRVRFTVDARPGKVFNGEVEQIRLNAAMTQNVVTYTVVVAISSAPEKLLPYLTAHIEFE